jgi:hypothetical protein
MNRRKCIHQITVSFPRTLLYENRQLVSEYSFWFRCWNRRLASGLKTAFQYVSEYWHLAQLMFLNGGLFWGRSLASDDVWRIHCSPKEVTHRERSFRQCSTFSRRRVWRVVYVWQCSHWSSSDLQPIPESWEDGLNLMKNHSFNQNQRRVVRFTRPAIQQEIRFTFRLVIHI